MYCPNCKQNFEDIDFCPCCVDDNGDSIKLIPTPAEEPELDNGEINIDKHIEESDVTDADVTGADVTDADVTDADVTDADVTKNSKSVTQDIDHQLLFEIQQKLHQEMGLEPGWMSDVKNFCVSKDDGSCEEGYRLAYEDMRKNFGRKLWIEVDKSGKVTRVITTK